MIRFDNTKQFVIGAIMKNNRLNAYKKYIDFARENNYYIGSLKDFYLLENRREGKHLVLRHDVDHSGIWNRKMFEFERSIGVTSTYYFRFSTIDRALINEMKDSGFDIGFHFETISDYIRELKIKDKKDLDLALLRERLKDEIKEFENKVGFNIVSCCSHGAKENAVFQISNNALTENQDMKNFGLLFEAYDKKMYEQDVDVHIMDNSLLYNYGFSYKDNPIDAINASDQNIIFLSHPNHWFLTVKGRIFKLAKFVLGKATYSTNRQFRRKND